MREILYKTLFDTPIGRLCAYASDIGLSFLDYDIPSGRDLIKKRIRRWYPESDINKRQLNFHLWQTKTCLEAYFRGEFEDRNTPLPAIDIRGTEFELDVWHELLKLRFGKFLAYSDLGKRLNKNCAQAIGGAVGRNPLVILVPCHRVIGKNGHLVGYRGGLDRKLFLIKHEQKYLKSKWPSTPSASSSVRTSHLSPSTVAYQSS